MRGIISDILRTIFGVYGAEREECFAFLFFLTRIIKAKVGAGAEIAV
jgi:hypothetical protein